MLFFTDMAGLTLMARQTLALIWISISLCRGFTIGKILLLTPLVLGGDYLASFLELRKTPNGPMLQFHDVVSKCAPCTSNRFFIGLTIPIKLLLRHYKIIFSKFDQSAHTSWFSFLERKLTINNINAHCMRIFWFVLHLTLNLAWSIFYSTYIFFTGEYGL